MGNDTDNTKSGRKSTLFGAWSENDRKKKSAYVPKYKSMGLPIFGNCPGNGEKSEK